MNLILKAFSPTFHSVEGNGRDIMKLELNPIIQINLYVME